MRPGIEGEWRTSFVEMEIYRAHKDTHFFNSSGRNWKRSREQEKSKSSSEEWHQRFGQRKSVDKVRKQLLVTPKGRCCQGQNIQISAGSLSIRTEVKTTPHL